MHIKLPLWRTTSVSAADMVSMGPLFGSPEMMTLEMKDVWAEVSMVVALWIG